MEKKKDTKAKDSKKLTPKDYDRWDGRIGIKVTSLPTDKKGGKKDA